MANVTELLKDQRVKNELNGNDYKRLRYLTVLALSREPPYDAMNPPIEGLPWFHIKQVKTVGERWGLKIERFRGAGRIFKELEKRDLVKYLPPSSELKVGEPYAITDAGYKFTLERLSAIRDELERRMEYETMNAILSRNPIAIPRGLTEIYLDTHKEVTVGRLEENDWSFPKDKAMSRRHARIHFKDGAFWIEDLKSTNGTWRRDEKSPTGTSRVEKAEIKNREEFKLGSTWIRFILGKRSQEYVT